MTSATPTIAVAKPATVVTLSCSSNSTAASIAESAGTRKNKLETLAAARCWRSHNMVSTAAIESTPIDHTSDQIVLEVNNNLVWPDSLARMASAIAELAY